MKPTPDSTLSTGPVFLLGLWTLWLLLFFHFVLLTPWIELELFWTAPVAGGLSLMHMGLALSVLLAAYLVLDLLAHGPRLRAARVSAWAFALLGSAGLLVVFAALGRASEAWGAERNVPRLVRGLAAEDASQRRGAAWELGWYGERAAPAVPALTAALDDPLVRQAAVQALGRIGGAAETAVPRLRMLLDDQDGRVRQEARRALQRIAPPRT
jgi:hypothetical protein